MIRAGNNEATKGMEDSENENYVYIKNFSCYLSNTADHLRQNQQKCIILVKYV